MMKKVKNLSTRSERSKQIFKKGDIVSPFSDVTKSNDITIKYLIKAKVIKVTDHYAIKTAKQQVTVEILEGYVPSWKHNKGVGSIIRLYSNGIKLILNAEHYEIF